MGINELQKNLIQHIKGVKDPELLQAIFTILKTSSSSGKYELSITQKDSIRISREEARNGKIINHEKFMNEVKSWLNET